MSSPEERARWLEPGRLVSLFEVDLSPQGAVAPDTPLLLHPYVNLAAGEDGTLVFMGQTYQPFPIHIEGIDFNTQGTTPRPKVIVSNIDSIVTAQLRLYGDFVACIVTRRRTYTQFLDTGPEPGTIGNYQQYDPDIFTIERKVQETATFVEFELTSKWDAEGVSLPRRQILAGYCPWLYRGVECSYTGPPVADKEDNPIAVAPGAVLHVPATEYILGAWVYTGTPIGEAPGEGLQHYRSLVANNNFALSDPTKWYHAGLAHNPATTYTIGDYAYVMVAGFRVYYASLANANTSALTDTTKWVRDDCSKRVSACKLRFGARNPLPGGFFPGAGKIPTGA